MGSGFKYHLAAINKAVKKGFVEAILDRKSGRDNQNMQVCRILMMNYLQSLIRIMKQHASEKL